MGLRRPDRKVWPADQNFFAGDDVSACYAELLSHYRYLSSQDTGTSERPLAHFEGVVGRCQ